ncbi:MAG: flagellar M-ring protein FliF, partial [Acetobacteraceae bacterium]|nr:flagellar M-ring protein FliF [Acetobacteraceae bacterium]
MKGDRMSQRVAGVWKRLLPWQKAAVAGVALAVMVGLLAGTGVFTPDRYAPLFTGLEPQDAAEIVSTLEASGVPYRLGAGGTAVLVPETQVYRARLDMAARGLPRGGVVGYEIMDRTRLGSTDFEQRISYLRALQGELARTIMRVNGVEQARVHIVLPEESLFISEKRPATAAVLLGLRPGVELGREQVQGIVHLVSRSVEALSPDDVTVIDTHGRILSAGLGDGGQPAGVALTQLDVARAFESQLAESLETLLQQVFGPANVAARVSAQINFDEKVTEKSLFEPVADQEGMARSVQELEEYFKGEGAGA